jgi:hypothetical protein
MTHVFTKAKLQAWVDMLSVGTVCLTEDLKSGEAFAGDRKAPPNHKPPSMESQVAVARRKLSHLRIR